jgi:hypothetical protein
MELVIQKNGRIFYNNKEKLPWEHSRGYRVIWWEGKNQFVHRLVAQAHIPNPEDKPQINHKNGNKSDNRVSNLEWCTPKENYKHAVKTGLRQVERKLSDKQVKRIRNTYKKGEYGYKTLAQEYNVSKTTIIHIIQRFLYKDI